MRRAVVLAGAFLFKEDGHPKGKPHHWPPMSEPEPEPIFSPPAVRRRPAWRLRFRLPGRTLGEGELPEGLVEAGVYPTKKAAGERGLVILSMKIGYWLFPAENSQWRLAVRARHLEAVRRQLDLFESEQVVRPVPPTWPDQPAGWPLWWGWCLMLAALHAWGGGGAGPLAGPGLMQSSLVFGEGETWRLFTAQTLHADLGHLAGNVFGILLFGWISSRGVGPGLALLGAVLGGALGFAGTAWWDWPLDHRSLGASATVFAALGVVTGQAILAGWMLEWRGFWKSLAGPLLGGLFFLGMLGGSDARTDLMAHLAGFAGAIPLGILAGWLVWRGRAGVVVQAVAGSVASVLILGSWAAALM